MRCLLLLQSDREGELIFYVDERNLQVFDEQETLLSPDGWLWPLPERILTQEEAMDRLCAEAYALIATCGYDLDYGAGLLDEGIRRWCKHSGLPYLGMYAVRDEDYTPEDNKNLTAFKTEKAVAGARDFANKLLEYGGSL